MSQPTAPEALDGRAFAPDARLLHLIDGLLAEHVGGGDEAGAHEVLVEVNVWARKLEHFVEYLESDPQAQAALAKLAAA